jgi:hypothetical protein
LAPASNSLTFLPTLELVVSSGTLFKNQWIINN